MSQILLIIAFILSIIIILVISKKSLTIGIFVGALFLGLISIPVIEIARLTLFVFTNINYLLLASAVALIPIIGTLLNESGLLERMIKNFAFGRRALLMFSPAILGLLPMPGGALFSAPMVDKTASSIDGVRKTSINVWYRHILHLVYPLATALIIGGELAGLSIYVLAAYQTPLFLLAGSLGFIFLLRSVRENDVEKKYSWSEFLKPLFIILLAPLIDFSLKTLFGLGYLATFIGVSVALGFTIYYSNFDKKRIFNIARKSKPWDFFLLILAIYLYQSIFVSSGVPSIISGASFSPYILLILAGFSLGFLTGRVSTPLIILIPIYIVKFGAMNPISFAMLYYSTLLGYIISPVHPCVVFTVQYFKVDVKDAIIDLLPLTIASLLLGNFLLYGMSLIIP